jgi:tetratricopeptide (TPR) repeat protein
VSDTLSAWLREQRLAHSWNMAEMGRQLHHAAKATGDHTVPSARILAAYVRRWEADRMGITERYRLHYCTAFGIQPTHFGPPQPVQQPEDELTGLATLGCLATIPATPDAGSGADLPYGLTESSGYRESGTGHNTVNRIEQQPHSDLPLSHVMATLAEESLDFGEWADTSNIGDSTLENYAAQVRRLAGDYQYAPPYPLLLETKRLRDRVFAKLQGHQRPGQTRDLYLVGAQVCGLLAWMSGDMSYYRAADAHAWTGWVCAEQANHDGARAWVRVTQSKLAYWGGRFSESVQLAEDGLRYPSTDSGRAMLAMLHGRALARLGRDSDAADALARATTALEQAGPDEIGGLFGLSQARYHHLAGSIHLGREDPSQVLAETRQALDLFEATPTRERNYGAEIGTRMDEAHAHLLLGDLDGADAALRPTLELAPENRYEPLTQHLRQVRQALVRPEFRGAALAQQLQEEIETFCREAIVNELPG